MSTTFSPSRTTATSRLQPVNVSRLRSSSSKKTPEPLRRAVADCLSPSAPSHHGAPSAVASEASRTLRDYLAALTTVDLAYNIILEHTLAEKERSPAVVARCIALLKRYLLRYKPSEETLIQIDRFCMSIVAECNNNSYRRSSRYATQENGATILPTSTHLPVSSFASGNAFVKSLNYVRSLVTQLVPKRSFQPALSSMLSKSFKSPLDPVNSKETSKTSETSPQSFSKTPLTEEVDGTEGIEFIAVDVLKWRLCSDQESSLHSSDGDHGLSSQEATLHNFPELGAAALLVGDMEAKMKGQPCKNFGTTDMPYLGQLLQPSLLTTVTNSASAHAHLKAITAFKRNKSGPNQIRKDSPLLNTFHPRARPLFQYRHYSQQQPLRLNPAEVCEVIAVVSADTQPPNSGAATVSSKLSKSGGKPSMDVAVSVLIKLVIDMYVLDSATAAPLALSMLEEMVASPKPSSRCHAFDLILNLGVHAHLLERMTLDDNNTIEGEYSQKSYYDDTTQQNDMGKRTPEDSNIDASMAISNFENWILSILYEILLHLIQRQEKEESVWASALSCLFYFICDRGKIRRKKLEGLDIRVIKVLIELSRRYSWADLVRNKLICIFGNMFYELSSTTPKFIVEQVDLIGGIEFVFLELMLSNSLDERRNLYVVLFDYVLHLINATCIAIGISEYTDEEILSIGTLLTLVDAPEAFYISVKLGVEGIGQLLRRSVSASLSTSPNSERLNMLLEKVADKFDAYITSFTHLDEEFMDMIQITKSYKSVLSIEDDSLGHSISMRLKLSWATLHSLLHSERLVCRQHGYVWLGDILMAEISEENDVTFFSNIRNLQQNIALAGINDYSDESDVPLPVWLMCGLLKSKSSVIRWGFLFVLERMLMRCKFLLDESELPHSSSSVDQNNIRLQKANAVIDIMSTALSLVAQINETDRINILKMCDILFSQLCLKVLPATSSSLKGTHEGKALGRTDGIKRADTIELAPHMGNSLWEEPVEDMKCKFVQNDVPICGTASMAALLLREQAIVPMQLIARVPAALFYWPLIQLAGAATDNIALGVSVGSKGRGNLPGATSDIRATLLLLLIGKCTADPAAFQEVGQTEFFRELLDDTDSRVAYYSSTFLLKRMMTEEPENYQRMLQRLIYKAQQSNNEKLLENPYLQMHGILQLSNE